MINCTTCELCLTRKRIVTVNGLSSAKYILITSHPSRFDETRGKIFSGEEQKFLEIMIDEVCKIIDIVPWRFLIIPMVRCSPRKKNETRDPKIEEILSCSKNLFYELNKTKYRQIFFDGKFVERFYKREFPDAITLPSIRLMVAEGGQYSAWYRSAIRLLMEGIKK